MDGGLASLDDPHLGLELQLGVPIVQAAPYYVRNVDGTLVDATATPRCR